MTRIIDIHTIAPDDISINGYAITINFDETAAMAWNDGDSGDDEVFEWVVNDPEGNEEDSGWARTAEEAADLAKECAETWAHWFFINGELKKFDVGDVTEENDAGVYYYVVETDGEEWVIFSDREDAGVVAADYWRDMAKYDRDEFTIMVGADNLVKWCLGEAAGPGTAQVCSLEDWFQLHNDAPEEHFAGYDGEEHDIAPDDISPSLKKSYTQAVAYRRN